MTVCVSVLRVFAFKTLSEFAFQSMFQSPAFECKMARLRLAKERKNVPLENSLYDSCRIVFCADFFNTYIIHPPSTRCSCGEFKFLRCSGVSRPMAEEGMCNSVCVCVYEDSLLLSVSNRSFMQTSKRIISKWIILIRLMIDLV